MPEFVSAEIADQVQKVFADLIHPVSILFFGNKEEHSYCEETEQLLQEVASLSPLLSLSSYDLEEHAPLAHQYKIDKAPGFVITASEDDQLIDYGIRYFGFPAGHEFTSLINDLVMVSTRNSALKTESRDLLKQINQPVLFQVFVTPDCAFCPQMVVLAHQLALECPFIEAEMIEAAEFLDLANEYGVKGVPHTVINHGAATLIGAFPEEKVISEILKMQNDNGKAIPKE